MALGVQHLAVLVEPRDLDLTAVSFLLTWLLCMVLTADRADGGIYAPPAAYLAVFGLFHGGLLLTSAVQGWTDLPGADVRWLSGDRAPVAAALAALGMIAFTVGVALVQRLARRRPDRDGGGGDCVVLGVLGLSVHAAGLAILAAVVNAGGGLGLLRSGYGAYLAAAQGNALLPYGVLALGVGPVMSLAAGGQARRLAWVLFGAYAAVAFPLGLRGEVLFPLVAMLVVEVRRGRRIRPLWTAAGTAFVMTLVGVVRQTRAKGVGALLEVSTLASPLDGVAEMGYSLRPTVVVLGWHDRGEPFRHGETLLAVPLRAFEGLLGRAVPAGAYDDRLFNVEIAHRVGPIGGSPVAEAYHNFGVLGVVVFLAMVGVLLASLTRRARSPWDDALLGGLLVVLLIQVRNDFTPVPLQVALVLLLMGTARLLARTTAARPVGDGVP